MLLGVLLSEAGVVGAEEEGDGGDAVLVGQGIVQDVVDDHLCERRKSACILGLCRNLFHEVYICQQSQNKLNKI